MSSVETAVTDIQNAFIELVKVVDSFKKRQIISEYDAVELLNMAVAFQTKLEYYKESSSIFSGRPYHQRTLTRFDKVIYYLSTDAKLHQVDSESYQDSFQIRNDKYSYRVYTDACEGIIYETKEIVERARQKTMSAVARSIMLIDNLLHQEVQTSLVELYGDLRLLADLTIFPIETKLRIKSQLVDDGFNQVADYLDTAEENYALTPPHLRDALSNCRNALESTITIICKNLGLQSTQRFSTDAGALQNNGFLDRETKDVVLSIWSYLSMKGSHSYSTVDKKSMSDVDFGLEQTYRIIAQLLTKHQARAL